MKFLILSCNTGGGHNSAAKAVKDQLELDGYECVFHDAIAFWSELVSYLVGKGHIFIYKKIPQLFHKLYFYYEKHPVKDGKDSAIYKLLRLGSKKLYKYILMGDYDAIIVSHPFAGMIATEVKRRHKDLKQNIYILSTDYTCSPTVDEVNAKKVFIPHESLRTEFVQKGVNPNVLCPVGIPINPSFYETIDRDNVLEKLDLPKDKKIILLMCGSMGCGPIKKLALKINNRINNNEHLVVICGSNKKLYNQLVGALPPKNNTIVSFTKEMPYYLTAADLVITKPGGLSTTESLSKGIPLVLMNAVPGCETYNLNFMIDNGYCCTSDKLNDLVDLLFNLVRDEKKYNKLKAKITNDFNFNITKRICDIIIKDLYEENRS